MKFAIRVLGAPQVRQMLEKFTKRGGNPAYVRAAVTGEVAALIEENFKRLNDSRNRHGSNFYAREGIGKMQPYPETGKIVIASRLIAHKLKGGVIRPKSAKSLAIPLSARAYGVSPKGGQIAGLSLVVSRRSRKAFLAEKNADGSIRTLHYLLLKSVRQKPQPDVLPSEADIEKTVQEACRAVAARPLGAK